MRLVTNLVYFVIAPFPSLLYDHLLYSDWFSLPPPLGRLGASFSVLKFKKKKHENMKIIDRSPHLQPILSAADLFSNRSSPHGSFPLRLDKEIKERRSNVGSIPSLPTPHHLLSENVVNEHS